MKWCSWLHFPPSHSGWVMWGHTDHASRRERYFPNAFPGTQGRLLLSLYQIPSSSQLLISLANPSSKSWYCEKIHSYRMLNFCIFFRKPFPPQTRYWDTIQWVRFNCQIQGPSSAPSRTLFLPFLLFQTELLKRAIFSKVLQTHTYIHTSKTYNTTHIYTQRWKKYTNSLI